MVHIVKKRGPVRANHNRGWPRDVQTGEAPRELPRAAGWAGHRRGVRASWRTSTRSEALRLRSPLELTSETHLQQVPRGFEGRV